MQRRSATIAFFAFIAAAGVVIALSATGVVNFQALEKLAPKAQQLFFPDGGLVSPPPVAPPTAVDAGVADAGTSKPDAGLKLKVAPEAPHAANDEKGGLLSAAIELAQATCTLSGKVTMKDGSSAEGRVIVYVESVPPEERTPQSLSMSIAKHRFEPALLPMVKDDSLHFLNPEGGSHSLFARSGANEFQLGPKNDKLLGTRTFGYRGALHVQCDLDEALSADVLVLPNRYFAVAGAGGAWKIEGVPKGERGVTAWEPNGGTASELVKCSGETTASLSLVPAAPPQRKHLDGSAYH